MDFFPSLHKAHAFFLISCLLPPTCNFHFISTLPNLSILNVTHHSLTHSQIHITPHNESNKLNNKPTNHSNSAMSRPPEKMAERARQAEARPERMAADFFMGGAAAVLAKTGAAPIERVKLLLQNQGEMIKRGYIKQPYLGIRDCFLRVFREEGVLAFWRGNQANVIRYFPTQAFNFAFRGYFKSIFTPKKEAGHLNYLLSNIASGSAAGAATSSLLYHLDFARTRLATDSINRHVSTKRQFTGLLDVYRKTIASDGLKGLYRGFEVNIVGITLYRGLYFGIYDTMKPIVLVGPLEGNFLASFALGWCVTIFSGISAYPFDTVRRRMMLTSGQVGKYRNALHAVKHIINNEGISALFRGVTANVFSSMAGAGVLAGYDQIHKFVHRKETKLRIEGGLK